MKLTGPLYVEGDAGMHDGEPEMSGEDTDDLVQQFVALGYVEDTGGDEQKAAENAEIESKYNVASSKDCKVYRFAVFKVKFFCLRR